jgi:parallel beta-helix repeat protein
MKRKVFSAIALAGIAAAFLISGQTAFADPNLVSHWKFDEGSGTTAYDSAGGNDGTINGNPQWVAGEVGPWALDCDGAGDYIQVPDDDSLTPSNEITIAFWLYNRGGQGAGIFKYADCPDQTNKGSPGNSRAYCFFVDSNLVYWVVHQTRDAYEYIVSAGTVSLNQWHYLAATFDHGQAAVYIDGQLDNTKMLSVTSIMNDAQPLIIGGYWEYCTPAFLNRLNGRVDDVRIYNRALLAGEVEQLYREGHGVGMAFAPNPANGATGVDPNVVLSWSPGYYAASHDVYLGTDYNDVNDANKTSPAYMGNYDVNTFDPCGLDFMTTYYWRIDEVNEPNLWKGPIWSFETGAPVIGLSKTQFRFSFPDEGGNPPSQILNISNSGALTLNWTIDYDCDWLDVHPVSGSSTGEADEVVLSVDVTGLDPDGLYVCDLTVSDPNAENNPQIVTVKLSIPIITVKADGTGDYPTIQAAINVATTGDEIVLQPGTYTGDGNRDIDFLGKAITVRSENGPNNCIIDCNGTEAEPHRGFCFHSGEDANSVVDGFTITNGYVASTEYDECGGGIYCEESSPTITNCTFSGNSVYGERYGLGGGMYNFNSSPIVTNCTFSGNSAYGESRGCGGGMCNRERSNPTVTNCTFSSNSGGGMYNQYRSSPTVTNCTFSGNTGGGMSNQYRSNPTVTNCIFSGNSRPNGNGGAIHCLDSSSPVITNCTFNGNSAASGGGIYCGFLCATTIKDCIINNNSAIGDGRFGGSGGGIYSNASYSDINIVIINSQINQNSAYNGGGICCLTNSNLTIKGCTINDNEGGGINCGDYGNDSNLTIIDSAICGSRGGGIRFYGENLIITDCVINGNSAEVAETYGGGIFSAANNSTITDSEICNNLARGYESEGGGIYARNYMGEGAKLIITNSAINGNIVEGNQLSNGGGILCSTASALIADCNINNNAAKIGGTKTGYGGYGGGIYFDAGSPIITKCKISGNMASDGGISCVQSSNTITDCLINGNLSPNKGFCSGVYCTGGSTAINNCTIVGHSSYGIEAGKVTVTNSILYYNGYGRCGKPQIPGSAVVTYSDVQTYRYYEEPWPGIGNIIADPCFVESGHLDANYLWVEGDYHLLLESPCINAGDPNYVTGPNETDLDGLPRVIGGRIDMGCYEFNHQPVAEAGPNQIAYADHTGLAIVTLDGSDSYDEDGQGLTYK